jgi:hypothetical protein
VVGEAVRSNGLEHPGCLFDNPINWKEVAVEASIPVLGTLLGVVLILIENPPIHKIEMMWLGVFVLLLLALLYLRVGGEEIVYRPRRVEIIDSGVLVYRRFWIGRKTIPWDNIVAISVYIGDPADAGPRFLRLAYIYLSKNTRYSITPQIAFAIREAYKAKYGEYPMRWPPEQKKIGNLS